MSWALIDLLRHPRELERVRTEQRGVLGGAPPAVAHQRYRLELIDPDPQPIPGQKTKWPQSPCRVRYQVQRSASRAACSSRLR